eukprot:gene3416-3907_t
MAGIPSDRRILHIAAEIAETDDKNVPVFLLELKDILASHIIGTAEAKKIRVALWNYDLTCVTNLALKQDFSDIQGGWNTATQLCTILCSACLGYIPDNKTEFKKQFLPDVVDSMLSVAEKIQAEIIKVGEEPPKKQLLQDLRITLQSLTKLFENYKFLALLVISAKKYMQLLMTEEEQTCLIMMILTQNILRADMNCIADLNRSRLHSIVDEIVFKILSSQLVSIASSSIRVLLLFMDLNPPLVELLSSRRYRGLRSYLKKWKLRGFDDDIKRLSSILEAKSAQQLEIVKLNEAASVIQAIYRGHLTRRKMKKANEAFGKFQRIYRERKRRDLDEKMKKIKEKEKKELEEINRRKVFLSSRTKQLKVIENIPAKTVDKFLKNIQIEAAMKIQRIWRGHSTRKTLEPKLGEIKRIRAAIKIQRQMRKWLARCRAKKKALNIELIPRGLSDERRVQLQNLTANMRERFPAKQRTFEELNELNDKMFHMLNNHMMSLRFQRSREDHGKALLAQLSVDSETLLSCPRLCDVTRDDVDLLCSRSVPVMAAARRQHNEAISRLKKPWWQTLNEERPEDVNMESIKVKLKEFNVLEELQKQF